MNVVLPPKLEGYVNALLETGSYAACNEVIEEALAEHQARRQGLEVEMTPDLERLLDAGLEKLDHARTTEELRRGR